MTNETTSGNKPERSGNVPRQALPIAIERKRPVGSQGGSEKAVKTPGCHR